MVAPDKPRSSRLRTLAETQHEDLPAQLAGTTNQRLNTRMSFTPDRDLLVGPDRASAGTERTELALIQPNPDPRPMYQGRRRRGPIVVAFQCSPVSAYNLT